MATLLSAKQAAAFHMGQGNSRNLVGPSTGAQGITLNYSVFQPGQEFPQHFHESSADIFIVLEGGVSVRQGDVYTSIIAGEFAYVPSPEVHGTVNTTTAEATLISFQAPPDQALYRGERDPSKTGTTPRPPENHQTTVRIDRLASREVGGKGETRTWAPGLSRYGNRGDAAGTTMNSRRTGGFRFLRRPTPKRSGSSGAAPSPSPPVMKQYAPPATRAPLSPPAKCRSSAMTRTAPLDSSAVKQSESVRERCKTPPAGQPCTVPLE